MCYSSSAIEVKYVNQLAERDPLEQNDRAVQLTPKFQPGILDDVPTPLFQPLRLVRRPDPFSHPDWLFEVKYDGFRALAYRDPSGVRLISRRGNQFSSFADLCSAIEFALRTTDAVLDGEIACLDERGESQFEDLLFRRGQACFCAFDLLWLDGKDLRNTRLIERKRALRKIISSYSPQLLYVDQVEAEGERLFGLICERDLEGIVAKHRHSRYTVERHNPSWIKIKNRDYSQVIGRNELFERRYEAAGAPEIGGIRKGLSAIANSGSRSRAEETD